MPTENRYLDEAVRWVDVQDPDTEVEVHIDLDEVNWVKVNTIEVTDGVVTCEYQKGLLSGLVTAVFPAEKITAARKRPKFKMPF